ncbi:chaplin [Streptomyces sp. NPDC056411]|uniref:chaplin n=1 Tax=Streptomyces sp. NPDC056411 TaxID=3345813 RepID=UPI0035E1ED04
MRQSLKRCVLVAAASGMLGASGGTAYADAGAAGGTAHSPGVLSGNNVQVSVDTPVNACGNSVDGVAALNPAMGNSCGNGGMPVAPWPPLAPPPPVSYAPAPAPEPVQRHVAGSVHHTDHRPTGRHRAAAPVEPVHPQVHTPAPRHAQDPRAHVVARAGESAGSALLASTGSDELAALAGAGGGLLLGGALLLRRARTRRR